MWSRSLRHFRCYESSDLQHLSTVDVQHVEDKRLLAYHDSDGTMMASASKTLVASVHTGKTMNGNGTVMTVQSDSHTVPEYESLRGVQ